MKKIILLSIIAIFVMGCASGRSAIKYTQREIERELAYTKEELLNTKEDVNNLRLVLKDIDKIADTMSEDINGLKLNTNDLANFWNNSVKPFIIKLNDENKTLKKLISDQLALENEKEEAN